MKIKALSNSMRMIAHCLFIDMPPLKVNKMLLYDADYNKS